MKKTRRKFTAAFKAKVAIVALKERMTLSELSEQYEIHPNQIQKWKQEFVPRSTEIFETKALEKNFESERKKLFAKIGELEMEKLKKNSGKARL
ncbi:MAG: transposase [Chloroflexi bacterium]|nr:transposase [Chloroflexota bacterium]